METTTTPVRGQKLFSRWYPWLMGRAEKAGQREIRRAQLRAAHGRTLEIGAGNGYSVPHFTEQVDDLVLLEPNPHFRRQLEEPARVAAPASVTLVGGDAHALDFPDASFDTVTASLTFCSVTDPRTALAEVHRVLKPGGRFLFHEHVRGKGLRAFLQDALSPLQRRIADGCHPNRDFELLLRDSDFEVEEIQHVRMPTFMPTIVPLVVGTARRAA